MLLELRDRLRAGGTQSLADLAVALRLPAPVVRDMLERWIAKGRVERLDVTPACSRCAMRGRCAGVGDGCFELYRWLEPAETGAGR